MCVHCFVRVYTIFFDEDKRFCDGCALDFEVVEKLDSTIPVYGIHYKCRRKAFRN